MTTAILKQEASLGPQVDREHPKEMLSPELVQIRMFVTRGLLALLWLYVPAVGVVAYLAGNDWMFATSVGTVSALVATVAGGTCQRL